MYGTTSIQNVDEFNKLQKLQFENNILKRSLDSLKVATLVFDDKGTILHTNHQCLQLLGYQTLPSGLLIQEIIVPTISSQQQESPQQIMKRAIESAIQYGFWEGRVVILCRQKFNELLGNLQIPVTLSMKKAYITDEVRTNQVVFCSTVKKFSKSNVNELFSSYQTLIRTIPLGICIWNCTNASSADKERSIFQLIAVNQLANHLVGVTLHRGSYLHETIDIQSNSAVSLFFWNILEGKKTVFHPQFSLGFGEFSLTAFPMLNNCIGMILEPCHISQYSKDQLFALDHSITPFCVIIKYQNRFLINYANFGFTKLSGYPYNEVKSMEFTQILQQNETSQSTINDIIKSIGNGEKGTATINLIKKNRETSRCLIEFYSMPDLSGKLHRTIIIFNEDKSEKSSLNNPPLSLYQEIFNFFDVSAIIWTAQQPQPQQQQQNNDLNFLLVAINNKAKTEVFKDKYLQLNYENIYLHEKFPNLIKNGLQTMFLTILNTNKAIDLGIISVTKDEHYLSKAFPIIHQKSQYIGIILEEVDNHYQQQKRAIISSGRGNTTPTHYHESVIQNLQDNFITSLSQSSNENNYYSTIDEPSKKRFRSMERAAWSNRPFIDDSIFREIVSSTSIGIILINSIGEIQFANISICRTLFYSSEEDILNKNITYLFDNELEIQYIQGLIRQMSSGEIYQFSMNIQFKGHGNTSITCSTKFRLLPTKLHRDFYISLFIQKLEV